MFRLIENKKAITPFYHEQITVHIYTLEELCFYLEKNIYLIDKSWFGENLFLWLEQELDLYELTASLRNASRKQKSIFESALLIFQASGNYSQKDLEEIRKLLEAMDGKTGMERRKMRGDLFFDAGKYRQAAYTYLELLNTEYTRKMTDELRGNIMHNLGVIYARYFLFAEAAEMFSEAYKLQNNEKSKECYLYAMNFLDEDETDDTQMNLNFSAMRDALSHLSEVSDQPEYYVKRKDASLAVDAYDWKLKQAELIRNWKLEYQLMNS